MASVRSESHITFYYALTPISGWLSWRVFEWRRWSVGEFSELVFPTVQAWSKEMANDELEKPNLCRYQIHQLLDQAL